MLAYNISMFRSKLTEKGASLVEYALLVALIAIVCVAAVTSFGGALTDNFSTSTTAIVDAG